MGGEHLSRAQNTKRLQERLRWRKTGSKTDDTRLISPSLSVSYRNHTWKHATHGRRTFVQQSGSLAIYDVTELFSPLLSRSHCACVFWQCGSESWKIYVCVNAVVTPVNNRSVCERVWLKWTVNLHLFCCCVNVTLNSDRRVGLKPNRPDHLMHFLIFIFFFSAQAVMTSHLERLA